MSSLLQNWGAQLPVLLIYLMGIAIGIVQLPRLPKVALPAVAGLALLLILQVVHPLLSSVIIEGLKSSGQQVSLALTLLSFVINVLKAGAIGALVYAVFADRPEASASPSASKAWDAARPLAR